MEWVAAEDSGGKPKGSGLRLVHRRDTSLRGRELYGCQYNPRDEFRKSCGIVKGLPLDRFAGADGLMLLFSMIAERELPLRDLLNSLSEYRYRAMKQFTKWFTMPWTQEC